MQDLRAAIDRRPCLREPPLADRGIASKVRELIVFHNTMWGRPLDYPAAGIPPSYTLTTDQTAADDAVAIVFHLPTLPACVLNGLTKRKDQLWIAWCMECDANYPQLNDPAFMQRFDLTMTYHLDSDVPVTYLDPNLRELLRHAPAEKQPDKL